MSASSSDPHEGAILSDGDYTARKGFERRRIDLEEVKTGRDVVIQRSGGRSSKNRHKSQPSLDGRKKSLKNNTKSSNSSSEEEKSLESSKPKQFDFMQTVNINVLNSTDSAVLQSTLLSINRIKDEKEFIIEDGYLKGGTLTAIIIWLVENGGSFYDSPIRYIQKFEAPFDFFIIFLTQFVSNTLFLNQKQIELPFFAFWFVFHAMGFLNNFLLSSTTNILSITYTF